MKQKDIERQISELQAKRDKTNDQFERNYYTAQIRNLMAQQISKLQLEKRKGRK